MSWEKFPPCLRGFLLAWANAAKLSVFILVDAMVSGIERYYCIPGWVNQNHL